MSRQLFEDSGRVSAPKQRRVIRDAVFASVLILTLLFWWIRLWNDDTGNLASSDDTPPTSVKVANDAAVGPHSQLKKIPGLADRTTHAPLADLFAKADPTADAQWQSEQFSAVVGKQLKILVELCEHPEKLSESSVERLIAEDYQGESLRPLLTEVFRDDVLVVSRRQSTSSQKSVFGSSGFVKSFRELLSIYAAGNAASVHLKFKVVGTEMQQDHATTTAYVEIYGSSRSLPPQHSQQTARWRCKWVGKEGLDVPLLQGIEVIDHEEVVPSGEATAAFVDYTEALLAKNPSYRDQLVYGTDYWYGNLDVAFSIHQGNQGLAIGDANGDGREDLFVCQPAGLPSRLYIQQSDGTLDDHTEQSNLDWLDSAHSALFVDVDSDGDQDLLVSLNYSLIVFENLGKARFVKRTEISIHSWPSSIAAADYDSDGDLDVYICGYNPRGETSPGDIFANPVPYHDAENGARNFMMRNDGNWDFQDVTVEVGLNQNNHRFSFATAWEDYDNDGDLDLYVANDFGRNVLFRNDLNEKGQHRFTDVSRQAGVEDIAAGMSVHWADYNHDGWMDLYVSNMFSSAGSRITTQQQFKPGEDTQTKEDIQRHARGNSLFENQGDGTFRDVSVEAAVTMGRWAWGSLFADINNDGWDDVYVANGFFTTPETGDL
ncbi:MAG: VCBS repeat-containing protein [Planctomycetales bacterium]|nr:VCBS repeat-containing protein [Planctomycetales bacterium]